MCPQKHKCKGEGGDQNDGMPMHLKILAATAVLGALGVTISLMHMQQSQKFAKTTASIKTNAAKASEYDRKIKEAHNNKAAEQEFGNLYSNGLVSVKQFKEASDMGNAVVGVLNPSGKPSIFVAENPEEIASRFKSQYKIDQSLLDTASDNFIIVKMATLNEETKKTFFAAADPAIVELFDDPEYPGVPFGNLWVANPKASPELISKSANEFIAFNIIASMGELPFNDIRKSGLPRAADEPKLFGEFPTRQHAALVENARYFAKNGGALKALSKAYKGRLRPPQT